MELAEPAERARTARTKTAAHVWHWATFAVGTFGVIAQLWIVATQALTEEMIQLSEPIRLWNVLSYFTIWSNILVTVVAYLLARNPRRSGPMFNTFRLASVVMITITGLIYALVLAKVWEPTGWQKIADETLHYSVPFLAVVGYLLFGPRPRFSLTALWAEPDYPARVDRLHADPQPFHHLHRGRRDPALVPVSLHQRR